MSNQTKEVAKPLNQQVATNPPKTITSILSTDSVKKRFEEIMGKKATGFMSSIISATKASPKLAQCEPDSIISSAVIAAILDLPIQSNLGFAHIVPYGNKATFQMGWKGFVQLAIRTGQYRNINATVVYEGELSYHNRITGEVTINADKKISSKIIGYVAYFSLVSGFEKYLYMTTEQCKAHGAKYSKSFSSGNWQSDFDGMALKTVIKQLLSKYGILSVDMQMAVTADQSVIKNAETMDVDYVDTTEQNSIGSGSGISPETESAIFGEDKELKPNAEFLSQPSSITQEIEQEAAVQKKQYTAGKKTAPEAKKDAGTLDLQ